MGKTRNSKYIFGNDVRVLFLLDLSTWCLFRIVLMNSFVWDIWYLVAVDSCGCYGHQIWLHIPITSTQTLVLQDSTSLRWQFLYSGHNTPLRKGSKKIKKIAQGIDLTWSVYPYNGPNPHPTQLHKTQGIFCWPGARCYRRPSVVSSLCPVR